MGSPRGPSPPGFWKPAPPSWSARVVAASSHAGRLPRRSSRAARPSACSRSSERARSRPRNARLASRQRHFAAELADKVSAARRELEELDRAKSAFVAIASHELRTPLTALQGFSELLAVRQLPPDEVNRLGTIMGREAKRLRRIVSALL